jgi:hypothetical protein
MLFHRWFRSQPGGAAQAARRRLRRCRPRLEALEDRTVLSAVVGDDFGNTFADARSITLSAIGAGNQNGAIDYPGDVDLFRFVAPLSGRVTIHQDATPSPVYVDPLLSVYDSSQTLLASNDNTGVKNNSAVGVPVVAGQVYYVQAAAAQETTGPYVLSFLTDDFGNDFSTAQPLTLSAGGAASQAGTIETAGDADVLQFTATVTGRMMVVQQPSPGSALKGKLFAYEGAQLVAASDAGDTTQVQFDVVAGRSYNVRAAGQDTSTGGYVLTFASSTGGGSRETEPNDSTAAANPIALFSTTAGAIAAGDVDLFQVRPVEPGLLTARAAVNGFRGRLSLLGPDGSVLLQSDGASADDPEPLLSLHVEPGRYFLKVEGLADGVGGYTLTTSFQPATPPSRPLPVDLEPQQAVTGDFNGDGIPDLVTYNLDADDLAVLLGLGDGTFQPALLIPVGNYPNGLTASDFNGDGHLDLLVSYSGQTEGSLLLGWGDGTFQKEVRIPLARVGNWSGTMGDVNGDGRLDLVLAYPDSGDVLVRLGQGDGTFTDEIASPAGIDAAGGAGFGIRDFNGDGKLDLAVMQFNANRVTVLLGRGDGTFTSPQSYAVGQGPVSIATGGDFNGDGHFDMVISNRNSDDLSILLGRGDGTFQAQVSIPLATRANAVRVGDFNGDRRSDLVLGDLKDSVTILLSRGDGTFQVGGRYATGEANVGSLVADLNGDGHLDIVTMNQDSNDVTVMLGRGDGTFQQPGAAPPASVPQPNVVITADFNGDGRQDLAVATWVASYVAIFLGRGDGTFQYAGRYTAGAATSFLVTGDFNGDGILDLATANATSRDVSVLLGLGDGTFQDQVQTFVGDNPRPFAIATGDFNEDGRLDLALSRRAGNTVEILLGRGDGTFQIRGSFPVATAWVVTTADFNGDGHVDLATGSQFTSDVSILLGRGDGTFQDQQRIPAGAASFDLIAADLNADGHPDLVTANPLSGDVSVILGEGGGMFQAPVRYPTGDGAAILAVADLNGDGILDLTVLNANSRHVSVLLGNGDGTFVNAGSVGEATGVGVPAIGDFNGDRHPDLVVSRFDVSDLAILPGRGDGTFGEQYRLPVAFGPAAVVGGDFNNDGRLDLARVNTSSNDLTVTPGEGDGTITDPVTVSVGTAPVAVVAADFNHDGRLDLVTVNYDSNDVSVLLGLGNGKFREPLRFAVGTHPTALVVGDFDGDGRLDLAIANANSGDVSILRGRGDGTFDTGTRLLVGGVPQALAAGDFNGDGKLDLAMTDLGSNEVTLWMGRGDGTFRPGGRLAVGTAPLALVAADFNGDGSLDLATADFLSDDVSVLLGRGDGTFQDAVRWAVGVAPLALAVADVNNDGRLDLAVANSNSDDVSILAGLGDGSFQTARRLATPAFPAALASGDFDNDGSADLVVATSLAGSPGLYLGNGDGTFALANTTSEPIHATPLVADLDGDGADDIVVVSAAGQVLLRAGRSDTPGSYLPPVVVNPAPDPAARDVAVVRTPGGLLLATLDARRSALSFYTRRGDTWERIPGPAVPGAGTARLVADDLNGDGLDDLVVTAEGSSQVFVYLQAPTGGFAPAPDYQLSAGADPSDVTLLDLDGDHRPDIVVASRTSGAVSVFLNTLPAPFAAEMRFRGGGGLSAVSKQDNTFAVLSQDAPGGLAVADFDGDGVSDLVVTHSGANTFSVLPGSGLGGFLNPVSARTFTTGSRPTAALAGRFNADPYPDLAILNEGTGDVSIFLGDGHGGFTEQVVRDGHGRPLRLAAGNLPTGLAVSDVNGDGKMDLLVGNELGDVLTLLGNGDGTFKPYQRADSHIALAVADLNGDGQDDLVFSNQALDRVTVEYGQSSQPFVQDRRDGLLAPGAVRTADLNGDGLPDLVVANSGANSVLVYLGIGHGQFGPAQSYFAGTNPVGVTVADLNGDGLPDLVVANQGSNDVSVLLGQGQDGHWTLSNGPRLRLVDPATGQSGVGPVATTVQDVNGDGIPDLLVSAPQSDTVFQINGVGRGLFDDQAPKVFATGTGSAPVEALVGQFDGRAGLDLITIDSGTNSLTLFSGFGPGRDLGSGGERAVAALAGDFNHDGLDDLIVANNDDGQIALFLGSDNGPTLARLFGAAGLQHPSDLALSADGTHLYVSGEGGESVARFSLDFGIAIPAPAGQGALGGEPVQRLASVLPLQEAAPATVATFLTLAGVEPQADSGAGANGSTESSAAMLLLGARGTAANLVAVPGGEGAVAGDPMAEAPPVALAPRPTEAAADGLTIGVDEALQRSGAGLRQWLLGQEGPATLDELPPAAEEGVPGGLPEGEARRRSPDDTERIEVANPLRDTPGGPLGAIPAMPAGGQQVAGGREAAPEEQHSLGWNLFLTAGLVSGLSLRHHFVRQEPNHPSRARFSR